EAEETMAPPSGREQPAFGAHWRLERQWPGQNVAVPSGLGSGVDSASHFSRLSARAVGRRTVAKILSHILRLEKLASMIDAFPIGRFAIEVFLPNGGVNRSHAHHSQEPRSCGGANPPGKAGENSAAHFVRRIHGKMVGPCRAPVERGRKRRVSRRRISVFVQAITYSFSHFLFSPHPALSRKQPA